MGGAVDVPDQSLTTRPVWFVRKSGDMWRQRILFKGECPAVSRTLVHADAVYGGDVDMHDVISLNPISPTLAFVPRLSMIRRTHLQNGGNWESDCDECGRLYFVAMRCCPHCHAARPGWWIYSRRWIMREVS